MVEEILIYWLLIFIVFLIVNLAGDSTTFGIIDGLWLMLLGIGIITTGVEIQNGMNITTVGTVQTVVYSYSTVVYPFGTYSYIWGIFFIGLSIYMLYANGFKRVT